MFRRLALRTQLRTLTTDARPAEVVATRPTKTSTLLEPFVHLPLTRFKGGDATNQLVLLPTPLFNIPPRPDLLHRLVVAYRASLRQGTASTKSRADVSYSGKKIRPQKGTGRARLGDRGSPMLRGGGRAHAKDPKGPDGWNLDVNRKEELLGLRAGISEKWRAGNLIIVDKLTQDRTDSAEQLEEALHERGWSKSLFLSNAAVPARDHALKRFSESCLSIPTLKHISLGGPPVKQKGELVIPTFNAWDLVKYHNIIIEFDALDRVIRRLDPRNSFKSQQVPKDYLEQFKNN